MEDPDCEQATIPDVKSFGHSLPATQAYASYLASIEYQPALIKTLIANLPKDYKKGGSTSYRVGLVAPPEEVPGQVGVFETVVRGAMYTNHANGDVTGKRDNRIIRFRAISKPTGRPKNLFQKTVTQIRSRGYEIMLIKPVPAS